jgi:superfamily II DNA helicase RecQ
MYRGEDFRPDYRRCVSLRGTFGDVSFLLLSATVTQRVLDDIYARLSFDTRKVSLVALPPDRPNIYIDVKHQPNYDVERDLKWLVDDLEAQKINRVKTLIFAYSISQVASIYEYFMESLDRRAYIGGEIDPSKRLVSMFHGHIGDALHQFTLDEFRKADSTIRVLISTVAFGMGIEIRDIQMVIHYGRVKSVMSYWQEVGRAGRDGSASRAIWYPKSTCGDDKV